MNAFTMPTPGRQALTPDQTRPTSYDEADLEVFEEYARCAELDKEQLRWLAQFDVPAAAIHDWDGNPPEPIRTAPAHVCGTRFMFPCDTQIEGESVSALIVLGRNQVGRVVDLVACRPLRAPKCAYGRVSMLGEEQALRPRLTPGLWVHRDVTGWLRHGRRGVVLVDPTAAAGLLNAAGPLIAEDREHQRYLRRILTIGPPKILCAADLENAV